jgi:hypothetical protein
MIRHIVMFRLKDFSSAEEKLKAAKAVKAELLAMKEKIPVIREFEVGINVTVDTSAFDVVINSSFESSEDLETYRIHPDHQAFIRFNKNYSISKAVIDYTIDR